MQEESRAISWVPACGKRIKRRGKVGRRMKSHGTCFLLFLKKKSKETILLDPSGRIKTNEVVKNRSPDQEAWIENGEGKDRRTYEGKKCVRQQGRLLG